MFKASTLLASEMCICECVHLCVKYLRCNFTVIKYTNIFYRSPYARLGALATF